MCNFYERHRSTRDLQAAFRFSELPNLEPRFVVRPTDTARVAAVGKDGVPPVVTASAPDETPRSHGAR